MLKGLLCLMLLLPLVGAIEFSLEVPQDVRVNESFSVMVVADVSETYDVKIFVHAGDYNDIVSEIEKGGEWANPYYYLKGAFPHEKEFVVRVVSGAGKRELCGRLRKSGGSGFDQTCVNVTVLATSEQEEREVDLDEERVEDTVGDVEEEPEERDEDGAVPPLTEKAVDTSPLVLNPSPEEVVKRDIFVTAEGKRQLWLVYGFTGLTLLVVLLLSLRRL